MTSFSAVEIYGIAEQIERNGVQYYRTAADRADGELKTTLLDLAEMEADHEKTFARMRRQLESPELQLDDSPGDEPIARYLQAMAEGRIFDLREDPAAGLADGQMDTQAVLRKAIDLEKDSIVFFLGLEQLVGSEQGRQQVHQIIREEIGHIGMLSQQLVEKYA
jgi:rubrerythrin